MNLLSTNIMCIALKPMLTRRLREAVFPLKEILCRDKVSDLSGEDYLSQDVEQPQTIPLIKIDKKTSEIEYGSAIALKLSKNQSESSVNVARTISARLTDSIKTTKTEAIACLLSSDAIWHDFTVWAVAPGWIYLRLSDLGLANWLQILAERPICLVDHSKTNIVHKNDNQFLRNSTKLFELQHTYARCCSQIRLAQQIGFDLVDSSDLNPDSCQNWTVNQTKTAPKPFPWRDSNHLLRFRHPADYELISRLVTVVDTLSDAPSQSSILKVGVVLSQSFTKFHAVCRVWGEVKTTQPELAQARLGLVLATRNILKALLEEGLGICAPPEL